MRDVKGPLGRCARLASEYGCQVWCCRTIAASVWPASNMAGGGEIDLHIATIPTMLRESIVLRFLDSVHAEIGWSDFGLSGQDGRLAQHHLKAPRKSRLVSDPTGGGEAATPYVALKQHNYLHDKITNVDDPAEDQISVAFQAQMRSDIELSFALGATARSRHCHGRQEPRSRNCRHCHSRSTERPSAVLHAAHHQCGWRRA